KSFNEGLSMKWFLFSVLLSTQAVANLHLAPPDFETKTGKAIFVDCKKPESDVTYNILWIKCHVKTRIEFEADKNGYPVFDLIPTPMNAKLNGSPVSIVETTAPDGSKLRQVKAEVGPGLHVLELENKLSKNVRYSLRRTVSSAF